MTSNKANLIFKVDIIDKYCHEWLKDLPKNHNKKIKKQVPIYLTSIIESFCSMILSDIDGKYAGDLYEDTMITDNVIFKTFESDAGLSEMYLKLFPEKFMKNLYKRNQDDPLDFTQEITHLLKLINSELNIDKSGIDLMNRILNLVLEDLTTTLVFTETNKVFITVLDLKNIIRCYFPTSISHAWLEYNTHMI